MFFSIPYNKQLYIFSSQTYITPAILKKTKYLKNILFEESLVLIIKHFAKYLAKILLSFLFIPVEENHTKKLAEYILVKWLKIYW